MSSAIDCDVISRTRHGVIVWGSSFYHFWIRYVVEEIKYGEHSREELFIHSLECYFGAYFHRCFAAREIYTKTTFSWAHKQFAARVHTLFSILPDCQSNVSVSITSSQLMKFDWKIYTCVSTYFLFADVVLCNAYIDISVKLTQLSILP